MNRPLKDIPLPDTKGYFGEYGGSYIPEVLQKVMDEITEAYLEIKQDKAFQEELQSLYRNYVGRPSALFHARNLSNKIGGAQIYLKREDLNHTGAHKINHCLGEALLAKRMGKEILIAETGAGQHGVALATAAALVGLECHIYMGVVDIAKEHPNVTRMKILGAKVVPVTRGTQTLKDAVDAAFEAYLEDPVRQIYAIGSVVGPHPFPMMVRDFQQIVGIEAREQFQNMTGRLPDNLVACVGGGSNAIGLFSAFLNDQSVSMYGVEPSGHGLQNGQHAATLTLENREYCMDFDPTCFRMKKANHCLFIPWPAASTIRGLGPSTVSSRTLNGSTTSRLGTRKPSTPSLNYPASRGLSPLWKAAML